MPKTVTLPDIPAGKGLEEFVAAFYQVAGMYVEKNIIQRETEEVLELDVLTTNYNVMPPETILTEVKSGGWGFSDIFKLRGWLDYLNISKAILVATKNKDHIEFYQKKCKDLSILVVVISDLKDAALPLSEVTYHEKSDELDVSIWRFSYWLERIISSDLIHKKKSATTEKRFNVLADYLHAINNDAFFRQTVSERMDHLCTFFKSHPHISACVAAEMSGQQFEGDNSDVPKNLFKETFYTCEYNDLQISTMVEHRARLALMKHAVDFLLFNKAGMCDIAKDSHKLKILGHEIEFSSFDSLPLTFREGIEKIQEEPYFHRYPVFWQWFMWVYGGFILLDKEEEEFTHISYRTGIPVEEVHRALRAYDALFPTKGGWFSDLSPNTRIRKLKMFPIPFMGLGAYYRKRIYCNHNDYYDLDVSGKYTISDLIGWNNAAVKLFAK